MQKVVIDTNCLISYVTDRNLKQQEIVSSVLEQAASLKICIYCHFHVISEFIFVLGFKNHYKIKLGASGYRFVYEVIDDEICILVIAIGKRNKNEVYKHVQKRANQKKH